MHEFHQVQKLVLEAQKLAEEKKAKKVRKATILVGELLSFNEGAIRLYWKQFSVHTPLEGCELAIQFTPIKFKCPRCKKIFERKKSEFKCSQCHVFGEIIPTGNECSVKEIII